MWWRDQIGWVKRRAVCAASNVAATISPKKVNTVECLLQFELHFYIFLNNNIDLFYISIDLKHVLMILLFLFPGLHLRSIEEPPSRMVSEQGGTTGLDHPSSRAPLSASNSNPHQQTTSQPQQYPNHMLYQQHNHNNRHNQSHQQQQQQSHNHNYHHHQQQPYDPELVRMESWMDENPDFVQDYFIRLVSTALNH